MGRAHTTVHEALPAVSKDAKDRLGCHAGGDGTLWQSRQAKPTASASFSRPRWSRPHGFGLARAASAWAALSDALAALLEAVEEYHPQIEGELEDLADAPLRALRLGEVEDVLPRQPDVGGLFLRRRQKELVAAEPVVGLERALPERGKAEREEAFVRPAHGGHALPDGLVLREVHQPQVEGVRA